jgi:hypothetical protein
VTEDEWGALVALLHFDGSVFCPPVETLETLRLESIDGAKIFER